MQKKYAIALLWIGMALISFVTTARIGSEMINSTTSSAPPENTLGVNSTEINSNIEAEIIEKILYVSDETGDYEIYQMDLSTKETINLTNDFSNDMNPQVSADGKYMVFFSDRTGETNQIFHLNFETSEVTQLTTFKAQNYDPTFSPDGSLIAFKSNRDDKLGDIFIMNADGSNLRNMTKTRITTEEWDPTFSIDGKKIIFTSRLGETRDDEIFDLDITTGRVTQLTNNVVSDWYPSVNPLNGSLLFISKADAALSDDIYVSNPDGTDQKRLTHFKGNDDDPAWSVDGEKIVFINDYDGDYDLYQMSSNGENAIKIKDTTSNELSPIFLP